MTITQQISPLEEFLSNSASYLSRLKQAYHAEVLTVDGKAEFVLMNAVSYQNLVEQVDYLRSINAIKQGLEEAQCDELTDASEFLAELKAQ